MALTPTGCAGTLVRHKWRVAYRVSTLAIQILSSLYALLPSGCGTGSIADDARTEPATSTSGVTSPESDSYDFGWVLPNTALNHEFIVQNRSANVWRLAKVHTTCGCTSAVPSRGDVLPGDQIIVPVRINSRTGVGTRTQRVTLSFADGIPSRILTVNYATRSPVVVTPEEQHLTLIPGGRKEASVMIENFSNVNWAQVDVTVPAHPEEVKWISIGSIREVPVTEHGANFPRQRWAAVVVIDPQMLTPGDYREAIGIVARSENDILKKEALIDLCIAPVVRAIPQSLVIFDVAPGEEYSRSLVFRFADTSWVPDSKAIRLTHDFPFEMHLQCSESSANIVKCRLSLTAPQRIVGTIRGQAVIEFGEPTAQTVSVAIALIARSPVIGNGFEQPGNLE